MCKVKKRQEMNLLDVVEYRSDVFKGATKLYFMHYLRVLIIFCGTGLYQSAFSTYSFIKTRFSSFSVLVFHVSISVVFSY